MSEIYDQLIPDLQYIICDYLKDNTQYELVIDELEERICDAIHEIFWSNCHSFNDTNWKDTHCKYTDPPQYEKEFTHFINYTEFCDTEQQGCCEYICNFKSLKKTVPLCYQKHIDAINLFYLPRNKYLYNRFIKLIYLDHYSQDD